MLLKSPGFTAIASVTLGLGIGANSAIFSIANALLLRPFPFENLDRLVVVRETLANQSLKLSAVSPADFIDWRAQNTVFQHIAAYRVRDITITGTVEPELVRGSLVSADFFQAVQMNAAIGRTFSPDESQLGRDHVAVLAYGFWQNRFAGDPGVLGQTIVLDGVEATVIGIMPPHFDFPFGAQLWMPLSFTPQQMTLRDRRNLQVLAHLKPDTSLAHAQAEMLAIAKRIERDYPQTNTGLTVQVIALRDQQAYFTGPLLSVLFGMAGFLLLIACANVANLLFARATTRQKEIAIRLALGARRLAVIRQLMLESMLLSCLAGAIGLILSIWAVDLIKGSLPADIARFMAGWSEIGVDGRVIGFTLAIAFLTVLISSLVPALQHSKPDLNETLKAAGRQTGGLGYGGRTRTLLVVSEIALALVLLVGAGLMVKGFWRTLTSFPGSDPDAILTLHTQLPASKYKDQEKIAQFYQQVISRLEAMPNVLSVGAASNTPLNNRPNANLDFDIEGQPPLQPGERYSSDLVVISPKYFRTLGVPLLQGRDFNEGDGKGAPQVSIISELMARRYWPGEDAIGRRFRLNGSGVSAQWLTIVGIVSDVKQSWFDGEMRPQMYLPYLQTPRQAMHFVVRTSSDPLALVAGTHAQIHSVDKDQLIDEAKTLGKLFIDEGSPFRFAAVLVLAIGGIALVLSAAGVYSLMSYSVALRTHEIGIRLALGAQRSDVLRLIMGQGARTAVLGLVIGLPAAFALSRVMAGLLFGIVAFENTVLIGFALLLGGVALASSYLPARRAMKVDAMVALRWE
jgi:putative ABC transport system permease protein